MVGDRGTRDSGGGMGDRVRPQKPEGEKYREVMIRMPADLITAVKERAEVEDRSMAGTVRYALRRYLGETE